MSLWFAGNEGGDTLFVAWEGNNSRVTEILFTDGLMCVVVGVSHLPMYVC